MNDVTAPLILVVDDFQDTLDICSEYLVYRGYRVITTSRGDAAIELARRHRPALILMDLRMGGMTGEEAMRLLRTDPTFSDVPIVAYTAHALEAERIAALAAGFDDVLAKPCLPDVLADAIERILTRGRAAS